MGRSKQASKILFKSAEIGGGGLIQLLAKQKVGECLRARVSSQESTEVC